MQGRFFREARQACRSRAVWRRVAFRAGLVLVLCLAFAALNTGCRIIQGAADLPGDAVRVILPGGKKGQTVDLVELQQTLMRFSDEFTAGLVVSTDKLRLGTNLPPRAEILKWKINSCSAVWGIASGQNALANLLDMVAVVTLARLTVADHWVSSAYGQSARPLLAVCQEAETNVWQIAGGVLNPSQQEELRSAILAYYVRKPDPESVLFVRAYSILAATDAKGERGGRSEHGSVFSLLMIDPLAGLSPATRELAQTRLFGERAVFLAQRMPQLLRWETETWSLNTLQIPEVQQLITNSTRLSEAVERTSRVAEGLPDRIRQEREKVVEALQAQQPGLTALAAELHQALAAGSQMASNVTLALQTFDGVAQRLDSGPPSTNTEPFRIREYAEAAARVDAASRELKELLLAFEGTLGSSNLVRLSGEGDALLRRAQVGGRAVVDHAFRRAVELIALACGLVLAAAIVHRLVAARLTRRTQAAPEKS